MRRERQTILFFILVVLLSFTDLTAQVPFTCDGRFYLTQVVGPNTQLVEVDINPATQEVEFNLINIIVGTTINGIGYRSEENLIYGVEPAEHILFRLDANGDLEVLANLDLTRDHFYLGADITPDGRFLVLVGSTNVDGLPVDTELAFVDLEDPDYSVEIRPLQGEFVNMLDIAFDPTDDRLYAFDSGGNRLVRILPDGTVETPFPPSPLLENAGSVFFDVFGDLFAYGSPGGGNQTTLYAIDKTTGVFRILTTGTSASATDACSCPFSVEVRKIVSPRVTIPCSRVEYSFAISNLSFREQSGILFQDLLPSGFTINSIIDNPFGGTVQSGVGTDFLQISDMTIPPGVDTLVISVDLDEVPPGFYRNQAQLFGLPVGLGETRVSDNPFTLAKRDSTELEVIPVGFDTLILDREFCAGESIVLDGSQFGVTFEWDDGLTTGSREVSLPGTYGLDAFTLCDTFRLVYEVEEAFIDVTVGSDRNDIILGDFIELFSTVNQNGDSVFYQWNDPFDRQTIDCPNCPESRAQPIGPVTYELTVTDENGCTDSDFVEIFVDTESTIFAPNVFSPNGDGVNDIFFLQGKGLGEIERLDIYNRWGGLVYSVDEGFVGESGFGWDGRVGRNGPIAEPAVFTWVADISYLDGTRLIISGDLTLVR